MSRLWRDRRFAYAVVIGGLRAAAAASCCCTSGARFSRTSRSRTSSRSMYLKNGTFGYVPGHPSAYTQPLYGWFLIVVFWIAGFHWWSVGTAQLLVAVATSVVVFETGRRFLSARIGLMAAVIATLQPYLVWHDLHGNREILDQLIGAAMFGLALAVGGHRRVWIAAALGVVSGIAVLSNARLLVLPLVLGAFLLWRGVGWAAAIAVPVLAVVAMAPWVARNKVELGCWAVTTDGRALWKANNAEHLQDARRRSLARPGARLAGAAAEACAAALGDARGGGRRLRGARQGDRRPGVHAGEEVRAPRLPVLGAPSGREGEARAAGDPDALGSTRRDRGRAGERRRLDPEVGRAHLHGSAVRARHRGALLRAARGARARPDLHLLRDGWLRGSSQARRAIACPGTSCSRCSRRRRSIARSGGSNAGAPALSRCAPT